MILLVRGSFVIFNMLLIIGGLVVGFYAYQAAGRFIARDTLFVAPFRGDGVIWQALPDAAVASRGREAIRFGDRVVFSDVVFCDGYYFDVHFMNFIEGGPWDEDAPSIILNENLAHLLFGGKNITGMKVSVGDGFYRIAGIVRRYDGYMAWMPRNNGRDYAITSMYVPMDNPIDARGEALALLGQGFAIVDINRYIESFGIRNRILLYSVWLWIMVLLFLEAKRRPRLLILLISAGAAVAAGLVMGVNEILIWLPNLLDPSISVFESLSNVGILPHGEYLSYGVYQISRLNVLANFAWIAGMAGLVNLSCINLSCINTKTPA